MERGARGGGEVGEEEEREVEREEQEEEKRLCLLASIASGICIESENIQRSIDGSHRQLFKYLFWAESSWLTAMRRCISCSMRLLPPQQQQVPRERLRCMRRKSVSVSC